MSLPKVITIGLTFRLTDLSIDRDHLLIKDCLPTKFIGSRVKGSWVISYTRCGDQLTYRRMQSNMPLLLQRGGGHTYWFNWQVSDFHIWYSDCRWYGIPGTGELCTQRLEVGQHIGAREQWREGRRLRLGKTHAGRYISGSRT